MITCRVRHINYKIVRVEQVQTRPVAKTYPLFMHAFFKEIKHILRNVFDLKRVKIGFSDDTATPLNKFMVEVCRILGCDPVRRGIFVVLFDGPALLFAGVISFA
jgi:hypothetical protein